VRLLWSIQGENVWIWLAGLDLFDDTVKAMLPITCGDHVIFEDEEALAEKPGASGAERTPIIPCSTLMNTAFSKTLPFDRWCLDNLNKRILFVAF
jgi:hypothetical protein